VRTAEGTHGMRCEHPSGITPRMKLCRQECARFHTWMKLFRSKNAASCVPSESKDSAAICASVCLGVSGGAVADTTCPCCSGAS